MEHKGVVLAVEPHGVVTGFIVPVTEIEQAVLHLLFQILGNIGMVGKGSQNMGKIGEIEVTAIASLVDEGDLTAQDMLKLIPRSACMQDCNRTICVALSVPGKHLESLLLALIHGRFCLWNQGEGEVLKRQVIAHAHPLYHCRCLELQISDGQLFAGPEGAGVLSGKNDRRSLVEISDHEVLFGGSDKVDLKSLMLIRIGTEQFDLAFPYMIAPATEVSQRFLHRQNQSGIALADGQLLDKSFTV
ncbi:hypothetical protein SDC9_42054 [bioreactor metagenome]|uniref:Uncharacterized protein n=1 Tax=bioreactor metagenome TaxID=1076179 RepID=A0A644VWT9_9ZZZZ